MGNCFMKHKGRLLHGCKYEYDWELYAEFMDRIKKLRAKKQWSHEDLIIYRVMREYVTREGVYMEMSS